MLKSTATALIAATLTVAAATQANEILDMLAPEASNTVLDANLRTAYSEAQRQAFQDDRPVQDVLPDILADLATPEIRYQLFGNGVKAETDYSCRFAVIEDVWVRISDC